MADWHRVAATTLYHVAPAQRRKQILEQGLLGSREAAPSPWPIINAPRPDGVYMWDTMENAEKYAMRNQMVRDPDFWRIDATGLNLSRDPYFEFNNSGRNWLGPHGIPGAFVSYDNIPPERIALQWANPWFSLEGDDDPYETKSVIDDIIRNSNILDPIQDRLDSRVFDYKTPRPAVVQFVKRVYYKAFSQKFGVDPTQVPGCIKLVLTGSLTTYQYSDTSDMDVSVFPNWSAFANQLGLDEQAARTALVEMNIDHLDGTSLPGSPHPLQFFTVAPGVTPDIQFQPGLRSGFDLDTMRWIVPPEESRAKEVQNAFPDVFERASAIAEKMKLMLDNGDAERAVELWKQVHKKRQEEQRAGGGDYSEGNIVYKWLVHEGLVERLRNELGLQIATHVKSSAVDPKLWAVVMRALHHMANLFPESETTNEALMDRIITEVYDAYPPNDRPTTDEIILAADLAIQAWNNAMGEGNLDTQRYVQYKGDPDPPVVPEGWGDPQYSPWRSIVRLNRNAAAEDWGPMKIDQLNEPYEFQIPFDVEQSFIQRMECPECHHHLRNINGQIYCEYCGWQSRHASPFEIPYGYDDVRPNEVLPPKMYHVAPIAWRESIRENGLHNEGKPWNPGGTWNADSEFVDQSDDYPGEWRPRGVYMWLSPEQADEYSPTNAMGYDQMDDIWEIDTSQLGQVIRDPSVAHNWESELEWQAYVTEYIPPSALRLYKTIGQEEWDRFLPEEFDPRRSATTSMQVMYDFEHDRITLGSKESDAHSKLIGSYDSDTNTATLFEAEKQWVNPTHFRRLWNYSFPAYPLKTVQFQSGEDTHTLRTLDHPYHERHLD